MKLESINPENYKVDRVIANDPHQSFAIAFGTWNDAGTIRFAMR